MKKLLSSQELQVKMVHILLSYYCKNYIVHGLLRRTSVLNVERIQETINKYEKIGKLNLHYMDLTDTSSISNLIKRYKPDEFYNLAAMSHVGISFYTGEATLNINTVASYRILESILKNHKKCKFYQASSSEMFGSTPPPQNERSSFNPQSPYGISKVAAFHTTKYLDKLMGYLHQMVYYLITSLKERLKFCNKKNNSFISKNFKWYEKKFIWRYFYKT